MRRKKEEGRRKQAILDSTLNWAIQEFSIPVVVGGTDKKGEEEW
jgi:hypothetical protein